VVRTAGHVLADAGYASVRYAVEELECELVVVLGHDDCGAVTAAHKGHVPEWLAPITMHIQFSADATLAEAVDEHVLESVEEVRDWLKASGLPGEQPVVVGAAYQLANGKVHWL
ncbi:MAG: carbonic anhydrase, partial [Actinomycetota bacterium]|nr:carbonic anhydrase [Actinomycetota bacterium]